MAAYAALVSVMQIIDQLEHHPSPPISIDKQQVKSLTEIVTSLQEFLEGYDSPFAYSDEADPLEMRIADAAYAVEDVIESFIVDTIELRRSTSTLDQEISSSSGKEIRRWNNFYEDVQKVIEEMYSIKKVVMEMKREKSSTTAAHQPQRNMPFIEKNGGLMVGFDNVLLQLLDKLTGGPLYRQVIPITGMGGIGKTTLARNVFQNALIKEHFYVCAWVTISQQYSIREIVSEILDQVTEKKSEKSNKSEEQLGQELYKYLYGRRYLIIMDDIWSIDVWEKMKFFLGDSNNGSRIIVTTRQSYLTSQMTDSFGLDMGFLDDFNSWNLFSKTVFREEIFPLHLEKIGRKIVKGCGGLPLAIVVVGGLLAKSEHTQEYWKYIEEKLCSIVNSMNDEYFFKILKMSYNHLPVYLKPCFLYMGIFEEDAIIEVSMLIKLWVSEGFLKPENGKSLETIGKVFLKELIDRNLIQIDKLGCIGDIRFCKMHDLLRDLCLKQAENERFYHVIGQHSDQGIHNGRRVLCPRRTSDDALKSMSHVRSMTSLCGHSGGVVLPNFRLMRILNAFDKNRQNYSEYHLEDVIHELFNTRYVAISNSYRENELPASVKFLWNLQTLQIFYRGSMSLFIAPIEIWNMSQLRHVDCWWKSLYLPNPPSGNIDIVVLENLQTLKGVANFKLGEEVVERIPNIKRLKIMYQEKGIEIEKRRGDYFCLDNLKRLHKLESLTCVVFEESDVFLYSTFPHSLRKLNLEFSYGNSIEWEEMIEKIGSLPLLQKLKLSGGCFRSSKWETVEGQFPSLKSLTLTTCDLKNWIVEDHSHFPCLEHLHLFGCLELKEIPLEIGEIRTLQSIKLISCSDSAVKSARKIVKEQEDSQGEQLPFHVEVRLLNKKQAELLRLANPNFKVHFKS